MFTIRSLEDSKTVIHGCSVPVDNIEGILVPYGDWAVDLYAEGVYNETLEFRSSLHQVAYMHACMHACIHIPLFIR